MAALFPPPQPIFSESSALAHALRSYTSPSKSREKWERCFSDWQKPAKPTEEEEIGATERKIRKALDRSCIFGRSDWRIIPQGSHHNNTNLRRDSDIDMCVCLKNVVYHDGPLGDIPTFEELGRPIANITFDEFRAHLFDCLEAEFGQTAVTPGEKAIHINKDDDVKINADVVPAFTYQLFGPRLTIFGGREHPPEGIALQTTTGQLLTNFPEQHYTMGCLKNDLVSRRYKRVVRILKSLREEMANDGDLPIETRLKLDDTASFLIECLVFNCPYECFQNTSIYVDVVNCLNYLNSIFSQNRLLGSDFWDWKEVNGIKPLFSANQVWTSETARDFVLRAKIYLGV